MSKAHRLLPRKPKTEARVHFQQPKEGLSPQRSAARKREALAEQQKRGLELDVNFLLTCPDSTLDNYELERLAAFADLRSELQVLIDRMIDTQSQAAVAAWFRQQDRNSLKHAVENPEDVEAWAKKQIRKRNRQPEEGQGELPSPSEFRPSLPPGAAHLAAAIRYQQRNVAEGKCRECTQPRDPKSKLFCTTHLAIYRERKNLKNREAGIPERKPNRTLAALREAKQNQEKESANRMLADRLLQAFPEVAAVVAVPRKCRLCENPAEPGQRFCAEHLKDKRTGGKKQRQNEALLSLLKG